MDARNRNKTEKLMRDFQEKSMCTGMCTGLRKPHWVRWNAGQWLPVLRELAADRPVWRALVRGVVGDGFPQ